MPAPRVRLSVLCMALAGLLALGGCTTASFDRKAEREANLGKDLQALDKTTGEVLPDRPLAFQEVLEIALRNNLELKVAQYELEIASRERVAARLDMLPRLDAEAASTRRSEPEVKAVLGPDGRPSGASSVSEPRHSRTADLTLTWNVLDFMTAAIRSEQREMQQAQLEYRREKIRQRIALDVITAYWRAAAAEDALEYSYNVKRQMERQYERLTASMRDRSVSLLAGKEAQLKLIELSIAIQKLHGNLSTARLELVQLMGLKQATEIRLQRPDLRTVIAALPRPADLDIKKLEFAALRNHPVLFENDLQARLLQEDTRAAMVSLFPGLSLFAGRHYDDSTLLRTNTWNAIGAELSWNLFALPAKFQRLEARELAEQRGEVDRVLVTASVITQVHLGLLDYAIKADRFLLMDDSYKITQDIEGMTEVLRTAGQATDMQYTERLLENLATKLRRDEAVVELFAAHAKLHASVGLPPESWQGNLVQIGDAIYEGQPPTPPAIEKTEEHVATSAAGSGPVEVIPVPVVDEAPIVLAMAQLEPEPRPQQRTAASADDIAGDQLWDLQVGAFANVAASSAVLEQIRVLAIRMLDSRDATVRPVERDGRVLHQVRFHRLPKSQARGFCRDLRGKGVDCWVTRSERG
ncbi:TolC family protein [Thauera phenylacetica]|uniref:TolC family protein n=1 Tax=Thauera phenylacetica TaxID=164400 RepID=UPI0039E25148